MEKSATDGVNFWFGMVVEAWCDIDVVVKCDEIKEGVLDKTPKYRFLSKK